LVVVPYWAVWPYETMILPKRQITRMQDLTDKEQCSLSAVMKVLCIKYDNLFKCSFPYSMGWHGKSKPILLLIIIKVKYIFDLTLKI
jgi:UDPglucose--hexose-1-phosphate uridylyltransferase